MDKKINFEFILGSLILMITLISFFFISSNFLTLNTSNNFELESNFLDVGSLKEGSDIKINGVKVGEVKEISLNIDTFMADVSISFFNKIDIPDDSIFKISNNGFVGSSYIEIKLGNSPIFFKRNDITNNNVDAISLEEVINNFIFK